MADHILDLNFEGHPETHCEPPRREFHPPANVPIADLRHLARRLQQCTSQGPRAARVWHWFLQRNGLFASSSLINYNRATLFLIQEWLNTKFTATGAMTAAFQRELQADPTFVWDNKLWDRKWGYEMTVAERTAHSCPYDRNIHG